MCTYTIDRVNRNIICVPPSNKYKLCFNLYCYFADVYSSESGKVMYYTCAVWVHVSFCSDVTLNV